METKRICVNDANGKHKFEPRYDEVSTPTTWGDNTPAVSKVYVCDVCVICGETMERKKYQS